jgi:hypothetical protein
MKTVTAVGIVLVLLGVVGLFAGGMIFPGTKIERGIGPLRVKHQQTITVPIQPVLSTILLLGGILLVVAGAKKS